MLVSVPLVAVLSACSDSRDYQTSFCAMVDISGTYASEKSNVVNIIKAGIVPEMLPGDSLFLVKIDSNSYAEENLVTNLTLDYRPTTANKQKILISKTLDEFANGDAQSRYTDISGALMLCSDYLKSTQSGTQVMVIFSDMQEELTSGIVRDFADDEFAGMDIAAMNVIKLNKDSSNPEIYRKRLRKWDKRTTDAGANSWSTIIEASKIQEFILNVK